MTAPPRKSALLPASATVSDALALRSATGVELRLSVAGPGARAYAYVIDWHVRLILVSAWYVLAALTYNRRFSITPPLDPDGAWFGLVVAPAAALYFLYHVVLEIGMRGRTPGKRIAGVRLVTHDGGTPTAGAIVTRNVFRLIDSFPVFYGVGLAAAMLTRNRVRIGDLAAGTLLVYERENPQLLEHVEPAAFAGRLGAHDIEVMNELLQRWDELAADARARIARELLARGGSPPDPGTDGPGLRAALRRMAAGAGP
ncbi:MAG TPA: RDD family protein [Steroidobacteraceae bacterium]|nr:RDD family protein [Steroidobacteraceae bacterium]